MAVSILIGGNQEILSRSPGNVIECAQHSIMSRWISTPKKYQACKSIWDLYCNPHLIRPLIGLQCALDGILLLYSRHIFSLNKYTKKKNVNMRSSFLSLHSTIIIVLILYIQLPLSMAFFCFFFFSFCISFNEFSNTHGKAL